MFDKFHDECGVVGVFGHPEASTIAYLSLHALQHRGQESAGVVSSDGTRLRQYRNMGLVSEVFDPDRLDGLSGDRAIGHVRYSTAGGSLLENAQPLMLRVQGGSLAVAHNGNLVDADAHKAELEAQGAVFSSTSDTEVILHLIAREQSGSLEERIRSALRRVQGAYSLVFLSNDKLVAARDPHGFRPLVLGRLPADAGGGWICASESCAFALVGAELVREVEPGEIVVVDASGLRSLRMDPEPHAAKCVFELVYFARPDSVVFGRSVYASRRALGRRLAVEQPAEVDVVVPVPDSGVGGALGFAEQLGKPFELGLIRSHYVGRTFIEPSQSIRHFGVRLKLSPVVDVVKGRRVAVVDDSLVRGTTSRKIVKMLRDAGAAEVHLRITAPPTTHPCFYGIDTPDKSELLAAQHDNAGIAQFVTADSVGYLTNDGMLEALGARSREFCDACFTGDYRVPVPSGPVPLQLPRRA